MTVLTQLQESPADWFTDTGASLVILGAAEPAITIVGASIPALRVLLTDFKRFTERRSSEQSESQGSNFDFWDDRSGQSRWSLFKWNGFGSSKSTKSSNITGTTSTISYCDPLSLPPPAGIAGHRWKFGPVETIPSLNGKVFDISASDISGYVTPKSSVSIPRITRAAPSHNYPNLSQQLEDFLWSRKNSYAGKLSDSIYDGEEKSVVETISKQNLNNSKRASKKRFFYVKPSSTTDLTEASRDDGDRDAWSLSSVLEDGQGDKACSLHHADSGQFVVVQTTEIIVEFE